MELTTKECRAQDARLETERIKDEIRGIGERQEILGKETNAKREKDYATIE